VDKLNEGYDVAYSYYKKKEHSFLRNLGSQFNNIVATVLLGKPRDLYLSSFKAINRFVIDEVVKYKGPYPYIDGLILRFTRNYGRVQVEHHASLKGKSGYTSTSWFPSAEYVYQFLHFTSAYGDGPRFRLCRDRDHWGGRLYY